MLTPQPSRATVGRWGTIARHTINVEIALMFVALFSTFLAIGYGSYISAVGSEGEAGALFANIFLNADLPIATFFLSWIHLGCLSNHSLNPVYALCMSLFMAALTGIAIWTWIINDPNWLGSRYSLRYSAVFTSLEAGWAPVSFRDTFGGIIGILYLTQMSLAARAIHNARASRRPESQPQRLAGEHDLERAVRHNMASLAIPSAPPSYYPAVRSGGGGGVYAYSHYGTADSSVVGDGDETGRPATVFSDLTTVKGDALSTVGEREVGDGDDEGDGNGDGNRRDSVRKA